VTSPCGEFVGGETPWWRDATIEQAICNISSGNVEDFFADELLVY